MNFGLSTLFTLIFYNSFITMLLTGYAQAPASLLSIDLLPFCYDIIVLTSV